MRVTTIILAICLLFSTIAAADQTSCAVCGMHPDAQSRIQIVLNDGTKLDLCCLNCTANYMKQHPNTKILSIKAADYMTKELIDAKTAFWVVGGSKEGTMSAIAKWAFAKKEDAAEYIAANGGLITSFDSAIETTSKEAHHVHSGHDMSHMQPGAQLIYNPAFGDDVFHTHPAGMWMVNYKFMYMDMNGMKSGSSNVGTNDVGYNRHKQYSYMMIPTTMTMTMQMMMAMYGVTDELTVMAMGSYQTKKMGMLMDMGPMSKSGVTTEAPMETSGFGDTDIRGIYKFSKYLNGSLGLSLPTGSINEVTAMMGKTYRAPYDMQLGSGTFDLKPAITLSMTTDDGNWNFGGQAMYTWHPANNSNGWSYGDNLQAMTWISRALGPASAWFRLTYNDTGSIKGQDSEIAKIITGAPMPDAVTSNYGGQRLDAILGISLTKGPFSFGVEGGVPVYQNLNGLQMKTTWFLTTGIQVMF
ncbi:MAG: nitrous oxide reductase accessory protein NosL [Candidatus Magnetominusculus sp. LBB02]|nr:nitrous oxide reductase accessory protein NosL [Candidatus Magnetominusculus sp. LBB02]